MPILTRYSHLSHPLDNLFQSIIPDLSASRTLEFYLASVPITPQKITPKMKNVVNLILYTLSLLNSKRDIENNNN